MKRLWSAVDKLFKASDEVFAEADKVLKEEAKRPKDVACRTCGCLIDGRFVEQHREWHKKLVTK